MNLNHYLQAHAAPGLALVNECVGKKVADFLQPGVQAARVYDMFRLRDVYFGDTTQPGLQAKARQALQETGHSVDTLLLIETSVKSWVKTKPRKAWELRVKLCQAPAGEIKKLTREAKAQPSEGPAEGVKATFRDEQNASVTVTASPLKIADLMGKIRAINADNPLAGFFSLVEGEHTAQAPQVATNVIIDLDELTEIAAGEGDDIVLKLTNGGRMTGAELVQRKLAEFGFVTLVHPLEGPVNAYRTSRFANSKQRLMLDAENPKCAWPDCRVPAEDCQYHHIQSWFNGGYTNVANLVTLCEYHNRVNEDSGPANTRGKMIRVKGKTAWQPPWGGQPI
ncbi:hypothetical protein CPHO_02230 [Corynebacterium phocae]|uniref:HNH nuclease domain-containing protein n=1 Tax=Corynebacterium phocae TaxID=161895 RepID=A0A1L7D1M0_9CORY|nr:HNH endonuclease signature motif containing protein [Corynebacterium phocae]APT91922.1 hypothetical protein CPHO_02230 [Corynebacterium phocae]KAA8727378.1 HNH endonuclease [Corynebacterium phocae]